MKLKLTKPFLYNEELSGKELDTWREVHSNEFGQTDRVRVDVGPFPDGTRAWVRLIKYEPLMPDPITPQWAKSVKRYILSKLGWREYKLGEVFNIKTDLYHLTADELIQLGRDIMAMAETDGSAD